MVGTLCNQAYPPDMASHDFKAATSTYWTPADRPNKRRCIEPSHSPKAAGFQRISISDLCEAHTTPEPAYAGHSNAPLNLSAVGAGTICTEIWSRDGSFLSSGAATPIPATTHDGYTKDARTTPSNQVYPSSQGISGNRTTDTPHIDKHMYVYPPSLEQYSARSVSDLSLFFTLWNNEELSSSCRSVLHVRVDTVPEWEAFHNSPDLLADLETGEHLPEAEQPSALRTELFRHQKQALAFMVRREQSWNFHLTHQDIWRMEIAANRAPVYINTITDEECQSAPQSFRGGILGDQMGLGKSLSALALIARDKDYPPPQTHSTKEPAVKATLIIVRAPLLHTWKHQLQTHPKTGAMQWRIHHSRDRIKDLSDLTNIDIVLTTYHTLCAEHRKQENDASLMFSVHWHRLVLDEAHDIRDHSRLTAKAMRKLHANCRWALTGTPIQNNLLDLASLYQFLRIDPYLEPRVFKEHINRLCILSRPDAMDRIKRLICSVMLRRPISHVTLPERSDFKCRLDFSQQEQAIYDAAKNNTLKVLDDSMNGKSAGPSQLNVLAWIDSLRMICNLGTRVKLPKSTSKHNAWDPRTAQDTYNSLVAAGVAFCMSCNLDVGATSVEVADQAGNELDQPYLSRDSYLLCNAFYSRYQVYGNPCLPKFTQEMLPVSTPSSSLHLEDNNEHTDKPIPTKVAALIQDLCLHIEDERCIVFSFWTSTLNIIEECLQNKGIGYMRFDRKVSNQKRGALLKDFDSNPRTRVALLSISCGAVGIDLTAASRAYLMEPHWNPSVEEQALARVYRMGQKRPVTTIRYSMRGSFEDHVKSVQERRLLLTDLMLNSGARDGVNSAQERLQQLRSLICGS